MEECIVEDVDVTLFFDTGHGFVVDLSKVNVVSEKRPGGLRQQRLLQIGIRG